MSRDFRDLAGAPAHASPAGAAPAILVATLFAAPVCAGTALMLAGPPSVMRSLILIAYLLAGVALCRGLFHLTDRMGWDRRRWLQGLGVATACALMMGVALFAMQSALTGNARWGTLPWILILAFGASLSGCALAVCLRLREGRKAASPIEDRGAVRFIERLPVHLRGADLWALQAEDHYLRVHTSQGEALILMRLSDAVAELDGVDGEQVRRSWWVARSALAEAVQKGRQALLVLKSGHLVPVSRTRTKELRDRDWLSPR